MQVWLELMDGAVRETCEEKIDCNREAQHKYLTWRAEKVWLIFHKNCSFHAIKDRIDWIYISSLVLNSGCLLYYTSSLPKQTPKIELVSWCPSSLHMMKYNLYIQRISHLPCCSVYFSGSWLLTAKEVDWWERRQGWLLPCSNHWNRLAAAVFTFGRPFLWCSFEVCIIYSPPYYTGSGEGVPLRRSRLARSQVVSGVFPRVRARGRDGEQEAEHGREVLRNPALGRSRTVRRRCCGCIAAGLVEQFPVIYRPSVVDFFRLFLVVDLLHQKLDHFGWLWFQNSDHPRAFPVACEAGCNLIVSVLRML